MLSVKRAQEIKSVFLNEIEETRTLPGRLVQPFFEMYNQELFPGRYAQIPCSCSPKEWIRMIEDVKNKVNEALQSVNQQPSEAVMEEPKEEPKKKPKAAVVNKK